MGTGGTRKSETFDYKVESFGPFEVHQRLGLGGMATVHLAMERGVAGFERWVALKRLLPHLGEDEEFVQSFVREAQLASRLSHPNVVKINQLGKVGDDYFISMEYIEGRDVRALLRRARKVAGPPPLTVTASLLLELLDALDYAHRKTDEGGRPLGIVHRDISPSNLLVNVNGHLKIIDFGIAKATSDQSRTQTGKIKGKLAYISPEVLRGKSPDARSDLFSVGIIAHELLTARPLFASKNDYKTIQRIQNAEALPPSSLNTNCPTDLDNWVLKALTKEREDRWSSAREMHSALEKIIHAFHLHATARDVASWVEWAFSLPLPEHAPLRERKVPGAPRAPTLGEAEEELLDIIWGHHGGPLAPLNLDDLEAHINESRDVELETDPTTAAPTALLFSIGPQSGHSDESLDDGWNKAVTIAAADRVGAEIESVFESTEPNGLVGPGDSEAFGTIDLDPGDWLEEALSRGKDSAFFSESELTALSEPLGGGPDAKTAPATARPLARGSLADLSPAKGDFDDTEPQENAIGQVLLPPPVMNARLDLSAAGPTTNSHPTTVRPVPIEGRVKRTQPPSDEPSTLNERPAKVPMPLAALGSEPKKPTTLRGLENAKPNPADIVILEPKKTKKRITARTTVPPVPEPEEPTVTVTGETPPEPPKRPAANVASERRTVLEQAAPSVAASAKPTLIAETPTPTAAAIARPIEPEQPPTPAPPPDIRARFTATAVASPPLADAPTRAAPVSSQPPPQARLQPLRDESGPVPLRAFVAPPTDPGYGAAPTVTEPPSSKAVPIFIALAVLSLIGGVVAYLVTREPASVSQTEPEVSPPRDEPAVVVDEPKVVEPAIEDASSSKIEDDDVQVKDDDLPDTASRQRVAYASEGTASVRVCIDRRGSVQSVRLITEVDATLRTAISSAVSGWTYEPYRRDYKPVKACFDETVSFGP